MGWVVSSTPRPLYPRERDPVPIVYEAGGAPQDRTGRVLKISTPPGFDPRTVQLVASRYIDCAIAAHFANPVISIMTELSRLPTIQSVS
jgi:hypothetical protein